MRLLLLFPLMLVTGPQFVMHDTVSKVSLMIKTGSICLPPFDRTHGEAKVDKIRVLVVLALALLISEPHHLSHAQPTDSAMTKQPASARRHVSRSSCACSHGADWQSDAANANYGIVLDMPIDENAVPLPLHGDGTSQPLLWRWRRTHWRRPGRIPRIATVARDLIDVLVSQESYIKKSKSFQPATSYPLRQSQRPQISQTPTGLLLARAETWLAWMGQHELSALSQDLQALLGRVLRAGTKKS